MDALFDSERRENVSQRSHYSHYYGDELRRLIASEDAKLIAEHAYRFESVKPGGTRYEYSAAWTPDNRPAFRKLLGRDASFLRLNDSLDVEPLRRKVALIPPETWATSDRNRLFKVHSHTQSVALVHFEDYRHERPEYHDAWENFREELAPIVDYIADYYDDNGFVVRALLAKLSANGEIPLHTDAGFSLMNSHRIHLPVVTNDEVTFSVGGKTAQLRAGEMWEINNATAHGVRNRGGDDRVHLIIDWMPNRYGKPVSRALQPDEAEDADDGAANEHMLASLVQQARQFQRSGQPDRAEALYRQVLHFDPTHVVAGNLLGLLCLGSRRFEEAVQHIERALSLAPDDAQAHANLGLALKECGRMDEAVEHFRASLDLAPGNVRVLNNLGGLLVLLGSAEDAIPCFREALRLAPGQAEIHFNLGSALLQAGHCDEAIQALEQCVALRPDFAEAHNRLQRARTMPGATRN
jgi:Flp pilus assembly protein TadD